MSGGWPEPGDHRDHRQNGGLHSGVVPGGAATLLWGLTGVLAATGVGLLSTGSPHAAPDPGAAALRVTVIVILFTVGLRLRTDPDLGPEMARPVLLTGLFCSLWLLDGSAHAVTSSVGVMVAGVAPVVLAALALSQPTGRLEGPARRLLLTSATVMALLWTASILLTLRPELSSPLLRCGSHCPTSPLEILAAPRLAIWLGTLVSLLAVAVTLATVILLVRRASAAPEPVARSLLWVRWVMILAVGLELSWVLLGGARGHGAAFAATSTLVVVALLPLAILAGLAGARLCGARALAESLEGLSESLEGLSGHAGELSRRGLPGQGRWMAAAALATGLADERERLEAELRRSTAHLEASRARLAESAHQERQRIERDLHDSVQQDLLAARLRLEMATDELDRDPAAAARLLESLGHDLDHLLDALRSVARGIYPALLDQFGLIEALRANARRAPIPVSVISPALGDVPAEAELAVYFCCLEALQNAIKHAGRDAEVEIRLWPDAGELQFLVADTGRGCDLRAVPARRGLLNMQDRVEAAGGVLSVSSRRGRGTRVRGAVPIGDGGHAGAAQRSPSRPASAARATASEREATPSLR